MRRGLKRLKTNFARKREVEKLALKRRNKKRHFLQSKKIISIRIMRRTYKVIADDENFLKVKCVDSRSNERSLFISKETFIIFKDDNRKIGTQNTVFCFWDQKPSKDWIERFV